MNYLSNGVQKGKLRWYYRSDYVYIPSEDGNNIELVHVNKNTNKFNIKNNKRNIFYSYFYIVKIAAK